MLDTSVSLLERIASRNQEEDWNRLLSIYRPFIDQQVRRYPQLLDQADDIAQEIAMLLLRELPNFQRQRTGSFRAWLRQVAVNQLRNASRKRKSQPIAIGDSPNIDAMLDELSDPASLAAQRWDAEHDREVLRRVVEIVRQDVNPTHWRAFQAHVLDEKPVALVAKELGISENVVLLAKSRITKKMQLEAAGLIGPS
jgi:RNA polymerase sigma-70 factor (ECF subfamily)